MKRTYEEIVIFDGIAERTGNRIERGASPGRTFCNSLNQLGTSSRRLGDGLYYLMAAVWPHDDATIDLKRPWVPLD